MRWPLVLVLLSLPALSAPRRATKPPKSPACDAFATCQRAIDAAFEATDFERAQRLSRQAEAFARTDEEKAQLLVLQGALDAQARPGVAEAEASARVRFAEAQRLDPSLTWMAIPAYARSDRLESLWNEARPPPPAPPKPPELTPPPRPAPVEVVAPPTPQPRRFPVATVAFSAVAVAAAGTGVTFGVLSNGTVGQRDGALLDVDRYTLTQAAQTQATVANVAFAAAGTMALTALFTWLFFE